MEARLDSRERLNALVRAELPLLYRVASRLTASASEAEDLVAHTLLNAAKGWHTFDGEHAVAWLIRIMRNCLARSRARVRPELPLERAEDVQSGHDTSSSVLTSMDLETALRALMELSTEHRLVITLCDIEEMPYAEVAAALELPVGTIASRLYRARHALVRKCRGVIG